LKDVTAKGFAEPLRVDEAWRRYENQANLKPLPPEPVKLPESLGRILAEDIQAEIDIPPFDRAAMDGYAVRAEDTYGASPTNPIILNLVGVEEIEEATSLTVGRKQAVQIATGAPLPEGADSVVTYEYSHMTSEGRLEIQRPVAPRDNVSRRGEDVKKGETVLRRGQLVKPYDIGMLAALGAKKVNVVQKPRVAIFSTGNELIESGGKLERGRTVDINRPILNALIKEEGGEPLDLGIVRDDHQLIAATLQRALEGADLVLCMGGTSVGSKDLVPKVVESLGESEVIVHGVSMRPGKPVALASVRGKPVVLLPGYPVAAIMTFLVFVRRILAKLLGTSVSEFGGGMIQARLARSIPSTPGVRSYVRVALEKTEDGYAATPISAGGSGIISSIVRAEGLVVIPEELEGLAEGEEVEVILLRPFGGELL